MVRDGARGSVRKFAKREANSLCDSAALTPVHAATPHGGSDPERDASLRLKSSAAGQNQVRQPRVLTGPDSLPESKYCLHDSVLTAVLGLVKPTIKVPGRHLFTDQQLHLAYAHVSC